MKKQKSDTIFDIINIFLRSLIYNIPFLTFVGLSIYMMENDISGYGWVVFAAFLCAVLPPYHNDGKDDEDKDNEKEKDHKRQIL